MKETLNTYTMDTMWEYQTLVIRYDGKEYEDWVLEHTDKPPVIGMSEILKAYGSQGWELVSLEPERFYATPGFGTWDMRVTVYRATFKRLAE